MMFRHLDEVESRTRNKKTSVSWNVNDSTTGWSRKSYEEWQLNDDWEM